MARGGDRNSDDDSVLEASSSQRSSSRDQLSDVSTPDRHPGVPLQVSHGFDHAWQFTWRLLMSD